jgi:hypothetical protein
MNVAVGDANLSRQGWNWEYQEPTRDGMCRMNE